MENAKNVLNGKNLCHDCDKEIKIQGKNMKLRPVCGAASSPPSAEYPSSAVALLRRMENPPKLNMKKILFHPSPGDRDIQRRRIKNGYSLSYENNGDKISIYKCEPCFKKDKALANYQACEVYSRIVGYIRPVQQWHKGKQQEFAERKEYKYLRLLIIHNVIPARFAKTIARRTQTEI